MSKTISKIDLNLLAPVGQQFAKFEPHYADESNEKTKHKV